MAKSMVAQSDAKWQAECDLETMINYQKIMKDSKRYKAAMVVKKEKLEALAAAGNDAAMEKGKK